MFLDQRRYAILKAIIESYLRHSSPVGSQRLLRDYNFLVSSATMRNEMAFLEQLGLIESPHTSAGRVPTDQGMRLFVDQLMDEFPTNKLTVMRARKRIEEVSDHGDEMIVKDAVSNLAKACGQVAFATMPWKGEYSCFGLSNLLKQDAFLNNVSTSTIVEMLEDREGFVKFIDKLNLNKDVHIVIGEENTISAFQSCGLALGRYGLANGQGGVIGVLGPKRMDYAYIVAALSVVRKELARSK